MKNHIMVDLETLSTAPSAVILSIGAVKMDLENLTLGPEFYALVDPVDQPGTIDAATVLWWLEASAEARAALKALTPVYLPIALINFSGFVSPVHAPEDVAVWGNGAAFDNVILRDAYRRCRQREPWTYRGDYCYRTMFRNFGADLPAGSASGVRHNALDDARLQATNLIEIFRRLRNGR
jgi:3'-5' exoribonuclease Rv2179c-like domain